MAKTSSGPAFQSTAIASGLITREEIAAALESMRAQSDRPGAKFKDEQLAAKLIEMGRLNYWQAEQLLAGRSKFTLGPYRILDSLGQGGMGQVFKGEHSIMRRVVAIKVLPRSKSTPSSEANFLREVQAQAQLDHENLVRAYDAGRDGNVHYLVTEYVPGTDLRRLIRRQGRLSMHAAAMIVAHSAAGLAHAHSRGLIHRDVKPGNLLVTPEGFTKVLDLGLAGFLHAEPAEQPDPRNVKIVGTADYLAPEQIKTPEKLTAACDIYALGCTLYYAVTGKVPFPGGSSQDKARAHCSLQPLDPRRLNPDLSDDFVDVIARMMAKEIGERMQSMDDVVAALSPWTGEDGKMAARAAGSQQDPPPARAQRYAGTVEPVGDFGETQVVPTAAEDDLLEEESDQLSQISQVSQTSQVSQGTSPSPVAFQETIPIYPPQPNTGGVGLSPGVLILIIIGLATAVGALGAIFVLMLFPG
ncbi:MAG: serine/threonine-protein kinase [Pirellulales bacterium]